MKDFDAFISHASEDKNNFVRPIAIKLAEYGVKIWYDELSLRPGVSLSRSIEQGLGKSSFGIVILSEAFFKKKWTEFELRALNSFEVDKPGIIIPVWYKIGLEQVRNFSPYLSDKLAITYSEGSIDDIVVEILEVIRPDIFEKLLRKKAWEASKEIGEEVAAQVIEIVHLRNKVAKKLGYENHYQMSLKQEEIDFDYLFKTLDQLKTLTDEPFRREKGILDASLAQRFNVNVEELRSWHYADPFFQEAPSHGNVDMDHIFKDKDIVDLNLKFYDGINLEVRDILEK
ncbi:MAG: TIR domain-containing protein, partial [Flavobacterium sp.]